MLAKTQDLISHKLPDKKINKMKLSKKQERQIWHEVNEVGTLRSLPGNDTKQGLRKCHSHVLGGFKINKEIPILFKM